MKKVFVVLAVVAGLAMASAAFADEAEEQCRQWAKDDNVSAEDMKEYMAQCVAEQREAAGAASGKD